MSCHHKLKEYSRRSGITTSAVKASFALLKRYLVGTFHHVGELYLQRYVNEFNFGWDTRTKLGFADADRANIGCKHRTHGRIDAQEWSRRLWL
jgi:ISXO2-like transposase domain